MPTTANRPSRAKVSRMLTISKCDGWMLKQDGMIRIWMNETTKVVEVWEYSRADKDYHMVTSY